MGVVYARRNDMLPSFFSLRLIRVSVASAKFREMRSRSLSRKRDAIEVRPAPEKSLRRRRGVLKFSEEGNVDKLRTSFCDVIFNWVSDFSPGHTK